MKNHRLFNWLSLAASAGILTATGLAAPIITATKDDNTAAGVRNSADATLTDTGTVNITVSNLVWYVNNAEANGNGTSASPFNSLAGVNCAGDAHDSDRPNDFICISKGNGAACTAGLPLESGQTLQSESVAPIVGGVTLRAEAPANVPAFSHHTASTVALSMGNTINGLIITNSGGNATIGDLDVLAPASGRNTLTLQDAGAGSTTIRQTSGIDRIFEAHPVNLAEQHSRDSRTLNSPAISTFPLLK